MTKLEGHLRREEPSARREIAVGVKVEGRQRFDRMRSLGFTSRSVWLVAVPLLGATPIASPVTGQSIAPPPPWSAILDCQAKVFAIDTLICEDAKLLASARRLEAAYQDAQAADVLNGQALAEDQYVWPKTRNICAFERRASRCISQLQRQRTDLLLSIAARQALGKRP